MKHTHAWFFVIGILALAGLLMFWFYDREQSAVAAAKIQAAGAGAQPGIPVVAGVNNLVSQILGRVGSGLSGQ
ncbi:MAG: hypothetical protein KGJ60_13870 [Verrucomicrobiota bacterium]|nr:hypothetical protein [Verrucomicrobiota bacterium]